MTEKSIEYLQKLRDIHDSPLYKHRRKTFVIGFIVALKSVRNISLDLLQKRKLILICSHLQDLTGSFRVTFWMYSWKKWLEQ